MKYEIVDDKKQGKVRKVVPAISNLIFVYTTRENIQSLKAGLDYLQYLTMPQGGKNIPVTVPEKQMLQFMSVCETRDNRLVYVAPGEVELAKGTPVKIVGGVFDGVEGVCVKLNKGWKKKVVVLVHGVAAVVIAEITDGYLQVLEL